jgi:hypothetical protein
MEVKARLRAEEGRVERVRDAVRADVAARVGEAFVSDMIQSWVKGIIVRSMEGFVPGVRWWKNL